MKDIMVANGYAARPDEAADPSSSNANGTHGDVDDAHAHRARLASRRGAHDCGRESASEPQRAHARYFEHLARRAGRLGDTAASEEVRLEIVDDEEW